MTCTEKIKQYAYSLGFDACGVSSAGSVDPKTEVAYRDWLRKNRNAQMEYMSRNIDKRLDPRLLVENAKSIISVALNYYPAQTLPAEAPQIAYYAYGDDYHQVVRSKLQKLFTFVCQHHPTASGRYFCDTAPVLERYWAARSGIGFVGKNNLLIIPQKGSYFFLGEIIIDIELDTDSPIDQQCDTCNRCISSCPTGALEGANCLNANKCISYQTIENKEDIAVPLHQYVYGCDICQQMCPHNRFATPHCTQELHPSTDFLSLDHNRLSTMNEETFQAIFRKSAIKRIGLKGLKRNVVRI